MSKIAVIYWSGTGNTEAMANFVAEGAREAGAEVDIFQPGDFSSDMIANYDGLAFGCPSMGDEVLEEEEFQPMWDEVVDSLDNANVVLFGSYGWGDGEWMRIWEEEVDAIATYICNEMPDDEAADACRELGAKLV